MPSLRAPPSMVLGLEVGAQLFYTMELERRSGSIHTCQHPF